MTHASSSVLHRSARSSARPACTGHARSTPANTSILPERGSLLLRISRREPVQRVPEAQLPAVSLRAWHVPEPRPGDDSGASRLPVRVPPLVPGQVERQVLLRHVVLPGQRSHVRRRLVRGRTGPGQRNEAAGRDRQPVPDASSRSHGLLSRTRYPGHRRRPEVRIVVCEDVARPRVDQLPFRRGNLGPRPMADAGPGGHPRDRACVRHTRK